MTVCDARARGLQTLAHKRAKAPRWPFFLALGATLALASQLAVPTAAQAQNIEPTSETIQDWTLKCAMPQGATAEQCILVQDRNDPSTQQPLMQVAAGLWGPERQRGLVITLPLGVTLPQGVELKVDETTTSRTPYVTCTPNGCQSHVLLDDALLQSMKSGGRGTVVFANSRGEAVPVNFSLSGFTAGIARIK